MYFLKAIWTKAYELSFFVVEIKLFKADHNYLKLCYDVIMTRHRARMGRNPKTKEAYEISERKVVKFYPSKVFRKEMNPDR